MGYFNLKTYLGDEGKIEDGSYEDDGVVRCACAMIEQNALTCSSTYRVHVYVRAHVHMYFQERGYCTEVQRHQRYSTEGTQHSRYQFYADGQVSARRPTNGIVSNGFS